MPQVGKAALLSTAALAITGSLLFSLSAPSGAEGVFAHRDDLSEKDRARIQAVLAPAEDFSAAEAYELMQGGAGTSRKMVNRDAFSHPTQNITFEEEQDFKVGNGLFKKLWVSSPSSTQASDGLGPLYNARSCQGCHLKDGRGRPPEPGERAVSMFLRLSVKPQTEEQKALLESGMAASIPHPIYGGQLQAFAVPGLPGEGQMTISYEDVPVELADGTVVQLRKPTYGIDNPGFGPFGPNTLISPRVAPQMIGLGLLEQVHEGDILAKVDPEDEDGDGISGRASWVYDADKDAMILGRFGWKGANATVRAQSAGAFNGDIGISTPDAPNPYGDCTEAQESCYAQPSGVQERLGDTEAPDPVLDLVTFYSQNLAVPARRDVDDPEVLRGKELFYASGCTSCHTPKYVTRRDAPTKAHRFQLIWPYTDLLLHDMGEGLADDRPIGSASGREWKTPPLWGIGLTKTVSDHTYFLHDGRARNLLEAVLWHGGEAEAAKQSVVAMERQDREALIKFLESL
ncbi:di-heme oxidoredictase family protein [Pseudovibrio exalbescens]|uniref:di-heme oxidoreductase family protein n=1 Tax=Pseudovibrio exalbescens TaxID=197461 RepID=UPI00236579A5|nr:di-heme oxidoredictase family protein [Pseudovibrio exalbescens]MDD7910999.1 di-heme oxidoredictase family protein [Pseudovibrio exalbescens]